jgi:hypothetical protein
MIDLASIDIAPGTVYRGTNKADVIKIISAEGENVTIRFREKTITHQATVLRSLIRSAMINGCTCYPSK